MALDTSRLPWKEQLEAAIRGLRDVKAASVVADGEHIREIHVVAGPGRGPKHIVRDVQTVVVARFGRPFDHRVVSVAIAEDEPASIPAAVAPVAAPAPAERPATPPAEPNGLVRVARIRFVSVNLYVSGPRAQAQVELRWKGISRMGSATGTATREGASQLVAAATVSALQEFLEDGWGLSVSGVQFASVGRKEVVIVALTLLAHRQEKSLVGSCTIEQDAHQAVVLATLAALNRVVGGLPTREPTEYVLRPTSTQEDSEAV